MFARLEASRPRARALLIALSVALFVALTATDARAQEGANKAAAEALFKQGTALMDQKDYAGACRKLDASQKLDPAVGTLLFLGECHERLGKTASAWASFKEAASLADTTGDTKRKQIAEVRASALEPQVSKLTVNVSADTEGLVVRRNGVTLPAATWNAPLPVDPGDQEISASAPGKAPWSKTVAVADGGETISVDVPTLADLGAGAVAPVPAPLPPPVGDSGGDESAATGSGMLIAGIVVGSVGVVGLGLGAVFGIVADGSNSDSLEHCRVPPTLCSQEGLDLRSDAQTQATVSTIGFIAGGVLVAGGLTLILLAPSGDGDTASAGGPALALGPRLGPDGGGLSLGGTW